MSLSKIHTLFNGPWYIEGNYGASQLPLLFKTLENNNSSPNNKKRVNENISLVNLNVHRVSDSSALNSVAILSIKEPIIKYSLSTWWGPRGTKSMISELDYLKGKEAVVGVVLDIDSGGGQVYGTPEFYDYILKYPKPIVAYTDGYMCSAAYYIGSATKYIVANTRVDAIGSIGASAQILDYDSFYENMGFKIHNLYGTKSTDKNKAYREVLKGNYDQYIEEELNPLIDIFILDMKTARPGINEDVFTGKTYNAKNAKKMGLIDDIGTLQTAVLKVFKLAKTTNNKNKTMTKLKLSMIEAVLGSPFTEGEMEDGVILTEENALEIEKKLSVNKTEISNAKATIAECKKEASELAVATSAKNLAAEKKRDKITASIQESLLKAEVKDASTKSDEEGIVILSNLITEYGAKDGANLTSTILDDNHGNVEDKTTIIGTVDMTEYLNN